MIKEPQKIYWTTSEVAEMFKVNDSLIRFWESEFNLSVGRTSKGNRKFIQSNIDDIAKVYDLVKVKRYTLEGAKIQLGIK